MKLQLFRLFVSVCCLVQSLSASPYVQMKTVREWLGELDSNHDHKLSRNEVFDALKGHHDEHLDRIDMVHRWQTPDWVNNDVDLTGWDLATFLSYRQNHSSKPTEKKYIQKEIDIFKKADTNNDGILDKEEYVNLLKGYGDDELKEKIADLEFSKADKNNDAKISYNELIDHLKPKSDFHEEKLAEIFENVDSNQDKYLNKSELLSLHNQLLEDHLHTDVDHFMERVDDNHDSFLTLEELRKHIDDITMLWTRSDDDEKIFHFIREDEL